MAGSVSNAGILPAFVDYARIGAGYGRLWSLWKGGNRSHAYLLTGPKGVGKLTFARYLAAALYCQSTDKPCGHCEACARVFGGFEPAVTELLSVEDKVISIERVREVIGLISQHTLGGGPRLVLIEPAEKLTPAAQNCLLKSLEDPPAEVIFLLLAHEPSALLSTIASRCTGVKLPPWPDDVLRDALLRRGADPLLISDALPAAAGNIGAALTILNDETAESELQELIARALGVQRDADVVALSTRLKDDREGAERALRALEQSLHQALLASTGILPRSALTVEPLRVWATRATPQQLSELLKAIFDVRRRRQSQVNWQASIDRLLMKIVEAKTAWQP